MNHYKSWSALRAQLTERLCPAQRGRITHSKTSNHDVHTAYGRAAIRLDGRELVCFSWPAIYRQDADLHRLWQEAGRWDWEDPAPPGGLGPGWCLLRGGLSPRRHGVFGFAYCRRAGE